MYVACTRAKKYLGLFVPATLYDRGSGGSMPAVPSPFVRELKPALYEELQESYTGGWLKRGEAVPERSAFSASFVRRTAQSLSGEGRGSRSALTGTFKVKGDAPEDAGQFEDEDMYAQSAYMTEWSKGSAAPEPKFAPEPVADAAEANVLQPAECGYCTHKIFGRGKVVKFIPPDKYQVNFPGVGLKVIMGAYLSMEK